MSAAQKNVLVTGASGFIGSHCVIQLLQKGYHVRGAIRVLERAPSIKSVVGSLADTSQLTFVECDLMSDQGWDAAMADIDFVLHIASPIPRTTPKNEDDLIIPAKEGVLRALQAAKKAGVARFVMTASTACIGYGQGQVDKQFDENDWTDPDHEDNSAYTRSKTIAEKAARAFIANNPSKMQFCTINPGAVLGPVLESDYGTSPEIVLKLLKGDFPGIPRLGFPLVDVRDVADLHIRAMESHDVHMDRFIAANEFMWVEEIAEILKHSHPQYIKKLPKIRLANILVKIASLMDPVTRSVVFELGIKREFKSELAKQKLGWQPRSNKEAIIATANTLIALGLV